MTLLRVCLVGCVLLLSGVVVAQDHPKFYITAEREAAWTQMKTDYDASPSSPSTYGGQMYKLIKDNADAGNRYSDKGQWPTWMYHVTGETNYIDVALAKFNLSTGLLGAPETCSGLFGSDNRREHFWQYVWMYDWLYPGLTVQQRTDILARLNFFADCADAVTFRPGDSDETIGLYVGMAMFYLSTSSYNANVVTIWSDPKWGGLSSTAQDKTTFRNAIRYYIEVEGAGGGWLEGSEYNIGTVKILSMGIDAIETHENTQYFSEYETWLDMAITAWIHGFSPGINQETSLPYEWGDVGTPRSLRAYYRFETSLVLAGIAQRLGVTNAPLIQDFTLDWLDSTSITTLDPYARGFLTFDPAGSRGDHTSVGDWNYQEGIGLYTARTGWTMLDAWFSALFPPTQTVDHQPVYWGEFQFWKDNQWAITHPITYDGPSYDFLASNTIGFSGLPAWIVGVREYREVQAVVWETVRSDFGYITGTQGGSYVANGSNYMTDNLIHENTRSILYLAGLNVIVIFDRTNIDPTPDIYLGVSGAQTWMDSRPLKELRLHMPISPTQGADYTEWAYSGLAKVRVTHLLPTATTNTIEDESVVWDDYWHKGYPSASEKKYHVSVVPDVEQQWDTFLNVWDAYGIGTMAAVELVQDTSNDVDAALITKGTENFLVAFNAIQGANLNEPSGYNWGAGNSDILDAVRIRSTGYSLTFAVAGGSTTTAILLDLDDGISWETEVNGSGSELLTVDSDGVAVLHTTATGSVTIVVTPSGSVPVTVSTGSPLQNGRKLTAYSETLSATGGDGGPYDWTVTVGSLPTDLSLSSGGILSGTPSVAESETFTVQACDSTPDCGTRELSLTIDDLPAITTTSLDGGTVGVAYSDTVVATGGTEPYAFSVETGSLCDGLSLAAATGVISGTPTTVETCEFTIRVTDDDTNTDDQTFSVNVVAGIGYVSVRVEPGVTLATVHISLVGLPHDSSCAVTLLDGEAVLDTSTLSSGQGARRTTFTGLQEDTIYEVGVDCGVAVAQSGQNFFRTRPSGTAGTLPYPIVFKPVLANAAKVRVQYQMPLGGAEFSADTECASGCTVTLTLTKDQPYLISHYWLDSGDNIIATDSTGRSVVVY